MPLTPGTRLGQYEILDTLGAGAMGEVYRARDTRLERDVALKIVSAHLSSDPEALARFTREARAVASLSHPHILAIHEAGEHDGSFYAVMELLDGQTLRRRLDAGALPVRKAVEIASQIARGLAAAHARGIVHRDLKPENVFLTTEGIVKILDFGVARVLPSIVGGAGEGTTGVISTSPGTVLGTVGYMAPEQVRGHVSDGRADIFALGCLLLEMLTGRRAFRRETAAETMTAILREPPDGADALGRFVPAALDRIVARCLEKAPDERFQSARDLAFALDALSTEPGRQRAVEGGQPWLARLAPTRRHRRVLALAAGLALLALGMAGGFALGRGRTPAHAPAGAVRAGVPVPDGINVVDERRAVAISRDGRRTAVRSGGRFGPLLLRDTGSYAVTALAGTEGAGTPFFSPDGQWLGFFQGTELKKISLRDGSIFSLVPRAGADRGALWTDDGRIVFAGIRGGLRAVGTDGGAVTDLTVPDAAAGEFSHRWPAVVPGTDVVLYIVARRGLASFEDADIVARNLRTGQQRVVARGTAPHVLPTGHLAYVRQGALLAVSFDATTLETGPAPVSLLEGIDSLPTSGAAQVAVADNGWLAYVEGDSRGLDTEVVLVARDGTTTPAIAEVRPFAMPRLSPDGRRLALVQGGPENSVWVADLDRGVLSRLAGTDDAIAPSWTPDGRWLVTSTARPSPSTWTGPFVKMVWQRADGSEPARRFLGPVQADDASVEAAGDWTPDGERLLYTAFTSDGSADVLSWRSGAAASEPWLATPAHEAWPAVSPDGRWVAYTSNESGRDEVYLRPLEGPAAKVQISVDGGRDPAWARDRRAVLYRRADEVFSVPIAGDDRRPVAGAPQRVVAGGYALGEFGRGYDTTRDGRVLLLRPFRRAMPTQVNLVIGWLDEARAKLAR